MANLKTQTVSGALGLYTQPLVDVIKGLLNRCWTVAGISIANGSSGKLDTANTIQYSICGAAFTTAAANEIVMTGAKQAVSTFCLYLLVVDPSGTYSVVAGTPAATSALAQLPDLPDLTAPVGFVEVATDSTHTFTPGTTGLDAAGITDSYTDMSSVLTY